MRASTEDEDLKKGYESPDPHIEEKLSMRPRLLARLEDHASPNSGCLPGTPRRQQQELENLQQQERQQQPEKEPSTAKSPTTVSNEDADEKQGEGSAGTIFQFVFERILN